MRLRGSRDRRILAILFTDIVASTDVATTLGDRRWRDLVGRHHGAVRRELRRFHGRERDTAGDGFFATFDEPTEAVHCALAIVDRVAALGLQVRAGVHIGETERIGQKVGGINVVTAARLMAMAVAGEVLTSGTLRDLVSGSDLRFEDRGTHVLKGVPGKWTVLRVLREAASAEPEIAAEPDRSGWRGVPLVPFALIGAAALGAVVIAVIMIGGRQTDTPVSGPNTVTFLDADSLAVKGAVAVGNGPSTIVVNEETAWVANADDKTVSVIERTNRTELTRLGGAGNVTGMAVGGDGVWIVDRFAGTLSVIDLRTDELSTVLADIPGASGVAVGFGYVWVTDEVGDAVLRVDPRSHEVETIPIESGSGPVAVTAGEGGVWVANPVNVSVTRIDPETLEVASTRIELRHRPSAIATGGGHVWVASSQEDALQRIDPATNTVTFTLEDLGDNPIGLAITADGVWVALAGDRAVVHLGNDGALLGEADIGDQPTGVVIVGDEVWVTIRDAGG